MNGSVEAAALAAGALHDETMAAFMGALDDIAASAVAPSVNSGTEEIVERVLGLFDTASTFYDADMSKNLELVNSLAGRLGEMACGGHDHMANMLETVNNTYGLGEDATHGHDGHNHSHAHGEDNHDEGDGKSKKKRKDKRPAFAGWFFARRTSPAACIQNGRF